MRDFNFSDNANTSATDIAGARPLETPPEALMMDETPMMDETSREDPPSLSPFHIEQMEEESGNLPKIVGAAVVGLLIVGGGIYAYETTFAHQAPVKTVAMKTTAPANDIAATPPLPAAPDNSVAPPTAMPEPQTRSAPVKSASEMPAPKAEPARQSASSAPVPGVGIGPTDDPAINAPMTYTADNAPPPQQPGASSQTGQTAMQQPITPPNVGNTSQPTASIAANQASGVTMPSTDAPSAPAQAPAEQVTQQPAQVQPAQPAAQ